MRRTGSSSSCPALLCPLVPLFHFCVWVTVWVKPLTHILTRTVSLLFATKNPRKPKFSGIFGAATQIRTGDLILTKRPWNFFLTIFCALWLFPLQATCFPSLFEHRVSAYSAVLCGWLCGQTVWGCNFRNLTVFTNIAKTAPAVFMSMPAIHKKRGVLYPRTAVVPSSHKAFSLFHDSGIAGL